jgi:hypothetical protein
MNIYNIAGIITNSNCLVRDFFKKNQKEREIFLVCLNRNIRKYIYMRHQQLIYVLRKVDSAFLIYWPKVSIFSEI